MPRARDFLHVPDLHWHDYGKLPRPGRKLGHVTVVARSAAARDRMARQLLAQVSGTPRPDLT
jgi:5-(carboxyamino)imidazole ribonucleotide synthase